MIFIDTSAVVALCYHRDALHRRAVADLGKLARKPILLLDSVLTESFFFLKSPALRSRLQDLAVELPLPTWSPVAPYFYRAEVFAWLKRYAEHEPDWTDGAIIVSCTCRKTARVWTYDSEFRKIWRLPNGSAVPMAV